MKYKITLIEDPVLREHTLVRLWTGNNLHAGRDPRAKYQWFYVDSPSGGATAFFLSHENTPGGRDLVGCCGLGGRRLWVDGQRVEGGLFADFAVDAEHRTVMPALMLQRALCADARARFPLTYGFPNDAAIGIFQRIGFPVLGKIGRFVRILRYEPFVRRVVHTSLLSHPAGAVLDAAVRLRHQAAALKYRGGHRFGWCAVPDDRFDALFDSARRRYRFIGDRSSAFLRWRFTGRPGITGEFATLVDEAGVLQAYAVVMHKHSGDLIVADFLASSEPALSELLAQLTLQLRTRGAESVTAFFLGAPAISEVLRSRGFKARESAKYIVLGAGAGLTIPGDAVLNTADWYLTEADRDN